MHALGTAPSSKRQLRLPGIERKLDDWKRARRDLQAAEFDRALERNGFRPVQGGLAFIDTTGHSDTVYSAVHRNNPLRIRRRATLAKLLRARARAI